MTLLIGRRPSNKGFTLIELILLTIIIAALVAVSTPQFRSTFATLKLKESSYNLAKLINFVQERAIVEGVQYKLMLDTSEGRYYFLRFDDTKGEGAFVRPEDRLGKIFTLPKGMALKSDKNEIHFYPDGRSQEAVITLTSDKRRVEMRVKGRLGYVEIPGGK
ncbi:MAG: hypothetical protein ABH875_05935 [Candidatus Omnitrophota bacterium]